MRATNKKAGLARYGSLASVHWLFIAGLLLAAAPDRSRLTGAFSLTSMDRTAVDAKIQRATEEMNFIVKPIARSKLTKATKLGPDVRLAFSSGKIEVTMLGATWVGPESGQTFSARTSDGDTVSVKHVWRDEHVVQIITSPDGVRENVFSVSADGSALDMNVKVSSPRLKAPLEYVVHYRRVH